MGMFTSVIHPVDGREVQIKTGNDNCDFYLVGDTVEWLYDKKRAGQGALLDGVA